MTEAERIALIGSASLILGAVGQWFFKPFGEFLKSWVERKSGNIAKMRQTITAQELEIEGLKNNLADLNMRLELLIPFLKRQLKDDPEAMFVLDHFPKGGNITPSKT